MGKFNTVVVVFSAKRSDAHFLTRLQLPPLLCARPTVSHFFKSYGALRRCQAFEKDEEGQRERVVQGWHVGHRFSRGDERFWQPWNHRYIVAFRPEQEADVRQALGADYDEGRNRANAIQAMTESIAGNAKDPYSYFSLGDDRLAGGDAPGALAAYDKAFALGMLPHFAWYNFGPYEALYRTGNFQRIFDLSAPVLKEANNVEEIHFWRGKAWLGLGEKENAKSELALAVQFNAHYAEAKVVLASIQ